MIDFIALAFDYLPVPLAFGLIAAHVVSVAFVGAGALRLTDEWTVAVWQLSRGAQREREARYFARVIPRA